MSGGRTPPHRVLAAPPRRSMWCPFPAWLENTQCQKRQMSKGISPPRCCKDKDSRGSIMQPPHPLLLLCGIFKRQILQWRKTAWESTSDRSFVKRCISFSSHFHPRHSNNSDPCCSLSPKGWISSASLLRGECPPITQISQPVCKHHLRDTQTCFTLTAAFVTTKDISGLFLNCRATLEWWTQRNGTGLANSDRQLVHSTPEQPAILFWSASL